MKKKQIPSSTNEPPLSDPVREAMLRFSAEVLNKMGFSTQAMAGQAGLLILDEIELRVSPAIEAKEPYGVLLHLSIHHDVAFPDGLEVSLLGQGLSPEDQAFSIARQFLGQIFYTVYDSLDAVPQGQEQILSIHHGQTTKWHVFRSEILSQGNWEGLGHTRDWYALTRALIPAKLEDRPFNWAMLSLIRDEEEGTRGNCSWNNADWPEAYQLLHDYLVNCPPTGDVSPSRSLSCFDAVEDSFIYLKFIF